MATDTSGPGLTITLIGQAASGKTNLLSTLLFNDNSRNDLKIGRDGVVNPTLEPSHEQDSQEAKDRDFLLQHYGHMLRGNDMALSGTNDVRRYPSRFSYLQTSVQAKGMLGRRRETVVEEHRTLDFTIVDGRGGDVAPDEYLDDENEDFQAAISRRQEYRLGLDDSVGLIICMPIQKEEFSSEVAGRMMDEITGAVRRKSRNSDLVPLQFVSLCFTKYETQFMADSDQAADLAADKEEFIELVAGEKVLTQFRPLLNGRLEGQEFETRIFPVSTFGFVGGIGRPNFYNYPFAPGLLTRAVDPIVDWTDPEKEGFKDHFPARVTSGEAETLWHPFNIAPPVLFALTGKVTGPIAIHPDELRIEEEFDQ